MSRSRLINSFICALAALTFGVAPLAQARSLSSLLPFLGSTSSTNASTSAAALGPTMPSQSASAPVANVYAASDAVPPEEARTLLSLAAALALVGILILEERWLYRTLERLFPAYGARSWEPQSQSRFGIGSNAAAQ